MLFLFVNWRMHYLVMIFSGYFVSKKMIDWTSIDLQESRKASMEFYGLNFKMDFERGKNIFGINNIFNVS